MKESLRDYYKKSLVPIFAFIDGKKQKTELVGTGIYIEYKSYLFICTDRHVMSDSRLKKAFVIPENGELVLLEGVPSLWSKTPEIDIGIYLLKLKLDTNFEPIHLIDPLKEFHGNELCFVGFPATKSKEKYCHVNSIPYAIEGILLDFDRFRISMKYDEKDITMNGMKVIPPDLHGMSGGAVCIFNDSSIELIGLIESVDLKDKIIYATKAEYLFPLMDSMIGRIKN